MSPGPDDPTPTATARMETATGAGIGYAYSSSTIVKVAIAAGIIVVVICAILLGLKISSWVRYRQRLRRQRALWATQDNEKKARAFELAAWDDRPGQAPVDRVANRSGKNQWWRRRKLATEKGKVKTNKRGTTNAYAVYEWEGTPA